MAETGRPSSQTPVPWGIKTPAEVYADLRAFRESFEQPEVTEAHRVLVDNFRRVYPELSTFWEEAVRREGERRRQWFVTVANGIPGATVPTAKKTPPGIAHAPPRVRGRWG